MIKLQFILKINKNVHRANRDPTPKEMNVPEIKFWKIK